jgi:hypothetical protein
MEKVVRIGVKTACILLFSALAIIPLPAEEIRTAAIDLVIVIDKSLSMEEHIDDVKRYIAENLIRPVLMPGDGIVLLLFYGKSEVLANRTIQSEKDKDEILKALALIRADGRWTDIGSALDALDPVLKGLSDDGRLKYPLLLTDEHQEAPPNSRYFSPDGRFFHPYLTLVKKKDMGGWYLITLGIGLEGRLEKTTALIEKAMGEASPKIGMEKIGRPEEEPFAGQASSSVPGGNTILGSGDTAPDSREKSAENGSAGAGESLPKGDEARVGVEELHGRWDFSKVPLYLLFIPPLSFLIVFFAFLFKKLFQSKGKAPRQS